MWPGAEQAAPRKPPIAPTEAREKPASAGPARPGPSRAGPTLAAGPEPAHDTSDPVTENGVTSPVAPAAPASREAAQRRVDRVGAFRAELAELEREGALVLTTEQRDALESHHGRLLERMAVEFEVDRTERERSLSAGMRAATLLGAVTLAAALYAFLYRFWGGMPEPLQALVVILLPLLFVLGMELSARRERTLYVTSILGVLAATSFVVGLIVLAALGNVALPPEALLAWAAFCGALAAAYALRLPLVAAILFVLAYAATYGGGSGECLWDAFGRRPETFLAAGAIAAAAPLLARGRIPARLEPPFRATGLLSVFVALLTLGRAGEASVLSPALPPESVEAAYQLAGLVVAALLAWLGARIARVEVSAVSSVSFVVFVYLKLYDWWWTVLPRWVFFLLLGVVAVACLLLLRRMHALARRRPA